MLFFLFFSFLKGDAFGFMKLCALIITELKNLSAASRANPQGAKPTIVVDGQNQQSSSTAATNS